MWYVSYTDLLNLVIEYLEGWVPEPRSRVIHRWRLLRDLLHLVQDLQ